VFAKTHLWYARFKKNVTDFPPGTGDLHHLAVFLRDELQRRGSKQLSLYVPGTEYDMDVDVFNGTVED
jgi:hypothetical protein